MKQLRLIIGMLTALLIAMNCQAVDREVSMEETLKAETAPQYWVAHQWETITYGETAAESQPSYRKTLETSIAIVPEPGTLTLLGLGITGLLLRRRMNRRSA